MRHHVYSKGNCWLRTAVLFIAIGVVITVGLFLDVRARWKREQIGLRQTLFPELISGAITTVQRANRLASYTSAALAGGFLYSVWRPSRYSIEVCRRTQRNRWIHDRISDDRAGIRLAVPRDAMALCFGGRVEPIQHNRFVDGRGGFA